MQELKIPNSNITVNFEKQVQLISTETIQQLENQSLLGRTWKVHDVAQRLNKGDNWVRKYILNNPRYLADFNQMEAEGTVWKPHGTSPWLFKATAFAQWLEDHMSEFQLNGNQK